MSLNKRELAWQKRKEEKIPKHMIKRKSLVVQDDKWREETAKEFADKHGAWWQKEHGEVTEGQEV